MVLQTSDNADLRSGAGPSKKARTSNEFVSVGDAAGRSEFGRTGACGVTSSPVAGQGDDASVSFSANANVSANNFGGKPMVFVELCAGSASLSAVAQKCGYRVMPVDCKRKRHVPKCRVIQLDLATDHAWDVLRYIVQTCDIATIHFAPHVARVAKLGVYLCPMVILDRRCSEQLLSLLASQTCLILIASRRMQQMNSTCEWEFSWSGSLKGAWHGRWRTLLTLSCGS